MSIRDEVLAAVAREKKRSSAAMVAQMEKAKADEVSAVFAALMPHILEAIESAESDGLAIDPLWDQKQSILNAVRNLKI